MRFFAVLILSALASALLLHFLPWWICMVIVFFLVLMMPMRIISSLLSGGVGVGLCWLIAALMRDFPNNHILSKRIAELMHLPSFILVVLICGVIGFITGALGGLSASLVHRALRPRHSDKLEEETGVE